MNKVAWAALVGFVTAAASYAQDARVGVKIPIPDAMARAEAQELVAEVYKADYDKAKTSQQKIVLAKKLLEDGVATADDPTGKFVLFRIAADIAAHAGDAETALHAIDEMDKHYRIDVFGAKATAIQNVVEALRLSKDHQELAPHIDSLIDESVSADRYDVAKQLIHQALASAARARDGNLRAKAAARMKEIEQIEREYTSVSAALPTLEFKPADPNANLIVGKFRCFIKGDWSDGLPMLALSDDATLKNLAVKELAGVADAGEQVAIANQWWDLSERESGIAKQELQRHAAEWYQRAWPTLTGLAKAKVQSRLKTIPLRLGNPVLILTFERETFANTKDGLLLKDLSANQNNGLVFGASPIKGKVGAALKFDGMDDYVLLEKLESSLAEDSAELTVAMWLLVPDQQQLRFIFEAGSPVIRLFYESGPGRRIALVTPGVDVRTPVDFSGEWHHFVGTRNASTQRLYLDGELLGEQSGQFAAIPNDAFGNGPARLGSQVGGCLGPRPYRENRCFNGAIDEFLILQHALTPFEVAQLYQAGLDGTNLNRIAKPAAP